MGKHIIKESQLRQIVEESVRTYLMENGMDEAGNPLDFVRSVGAGLRNAFGGDVDKVKNAAQGAWDGVKQAGQAVSDKAVSAYNNVAQGVNQRVNDFKQNYQAQKDATAAMDAAKSGEKEANKAIATLRKLQGKGVISSPGAVQALNKLEQCLLMQNKRRYQQAGQMQAKVK